MVNLLTGLFAIYVCSPHTYRKVQPASQGGKSTKWRCFFSFLKKMHTITTRGTVCKFEHNIKVPKFFRMLGQKIGCGSGSDKIIPNPDPQRCWSSNISFYLLQYWLTGCMLRMALYLLITKEFLVLLIVVRLWGGGQYANMQRKA
jgi:hypothetical protein